jgi:hypothetical protein
MVLKHAGSAFLCAVILGWNGMALAESYRAGEFFSLDLSSAVLSPKPLGPAAQFAPVRIEARTDKLGETAPARPEPKAARAIVVPKAKVASRAEKPHVASAKVARQRGNPLDAQARDTRIQVWPCKSGGICDWGQP